MDRVYDYARQVWIDAMETRQKYLTQDEKDLLPGLSKEQQEALCTLKDFNLDWGKRHAAGQKLPNEVLKILALGYKHHARQSIPWIILRERGVLA